MREKNNKKITTKKKALLLTTLGLTAFTIPMVAQKTVFLEQVSAFEKDVLGRPTINLNQESIELQPGTILPDWSTYVDSILDNEGNPLTFEDNVVVDDLAIDQDGDKLVDDILEGEVPQVTYTATDPITSKSATKTLDVTPINNVPTITLNQSVVDLPSDSTSINWLSYVDSLEDNGHSILKSKIVVDGGDVDSDLNGEIDPGSVGGDVTYTYTDAVGNTATEVLRVRVTSSTTEPELILTTAPVTVAPGDVIDWSSYITRATAIDGSAITDKSFLSVDDTAIDLDDNDVVDTDVVDDTYTVTYTLTDPSDSSKTTTKTLDVVVSSLADTTAPTITFIQNPLTVVKGSTMTELDWKEQVEAEDDIDGTLPLGSIDVDVTSVDSDMDGVIDADPGTQNVIYTATDSSGNTVTEDLEVVIEADTTAPTITFIQNPLTLEEGSTMTELEWKEQAVAQDDIDGTLPIDSIDVDVTPVDSDIDGVIDVDPGTQNITYTATDSSGNSATQDLEVVISDTTAPAIKLNTDQIQVEEGSTILRSDWESYIEAIGDNIDTLSNTDAVIDVTQVDSDMDGLIDVDPGTYKVYYSVTDAAGNVSDKVELEVVVVAKDYAPALKLKTYRTGYEKGSVVTQDQWRNYIKAVGDDVDDLNISDVDIDTSAVGTINSETGDTTIQNPGNVVYTLADTAGNVTTVNLEVVVSTEMDGILFTKEVTGGSGEDGRAKPLDVLHYKYTITNNSFAKGTLTSAVLMDPLGDLDLDYTSVANLTVDGIPSTDSITDITTGVHLGDINIGESVVVELDATARAIFDQTPAIDSEARVYAGNYTVPVLGTPKAIKEDTVDIYKDITLPPTTDTTAPTITFSQNPITVVKGSSVSLLDWKKQAEAEDDVDGILPLAAIDVDVTQVDSDMDGIIDADPGTKNVMYTATDSSGNSSSEVLVVNVVEELDGILFTKEVTGGSGEDGRAKPLDVLHYKYTITNNSFAKGTLTNAVLMDPLGDLDLDYTSVANLTVDGTPSTDSITDITTGVHLGDINIGESVVVELDATAKAMFDQTPAIDSEARVYADNYTVPVLGTPKAIKEDIIDIYKDISISSELQNGVLFTKTVTDDALGNTIINNKASEGETLHYKYEIENVSFDSGESFEIENIMLTDDLDFEDLDQTSLGNVKSYKNDKMPIDVAGQDITTGITFDSTIGGNKLERGEKISLEFDINVKDTFGSTDTNIDSTATLTADNFTETLATDNEIDIEKDISTSTNEAPQIILTTNTVDYKKGDFVSKSEWLGYIDSISDDNDTLTLADVTLDVSEVDEDMDGMIDDLAAGTYVVTYTVEDSEGLTTTAELVVNIFEEEEGILFTKQVTGGTGVDGKAKAGDLLTYTYKIENSSFDNGLGGTTFENVVLTDPLDDVDLDPTTATITFASNNGEPITPSGTITDGLELGNLELGDVIEVEFTVNAAGEFDESPDINSTAFINASNYTTFLKSSKEISENIVDIYKDMDETLEEAPVIELTTSSIQVAQDQIMTNDDWKGFISSVTDDVDTLTIGDVIVDPKQVDTDLNGTIDVGAGDYNVFYTVEDSDGNIGKTELQVNVVEPQDGIIFIKNVTGGTGENGKAKVGDTLNYSYKVKNESFDDGMGGTTMSEVTLTDLLDDADLNKTSLTNLVIKDITGTELEIAGSLDTGLELGDIELGQEVEVTFDIDTAAEFDITPEIDSSAYVQAENYNKMFKLFNKVEENIVDIYKDNDDIADKEAPVIDFGDNPSIEVIKGSTVSKIQWKSIPTVEDDIDGTIPLSAIDVDPTEVDENLDGIIDAEVSDEPYAVHYTAHDSAGNVATKDLEVKVIKEDVAENQAPIINLSKSKVSFDKGEEEPNWLNYVSSVEDEEVLSVDDVVVDATDVDMNQEGTYEVIYSVTDSKGLEGSATLTVIIGDVDEGPEITLYDSEVTYEVGSSEPNWEDNIKKVEDDEDDLDLSDVQIDSSEVNMNEIGTYNVKYTVEDSDGNSDSATLKVKIVDGDYSDHAPVINLTVDQVSLYIGSGMPNWLNYVSSVSDQEDDLGIEDLVIDDSSVNLNKVGTYSVVYSLTDSDNNTTTKKISVKIVEKDENGETLTNTAKTKMSVLMTLIVAGLGILKLNRKNSKK